MGDRKGVGGSSDEVDTRVDDNVAPLNVSSVPSGVVQVHGGFQVQQQSQNSVIRWERFLPTKSLNVLLVENDDSTRHVLSALLRNCSYEVTAAANALRAWKILEDMNNHIDVILTEVVMPNVSGIGLLCKIMSHKSLKNIPVIMMSSHDSMGIVFKCLSKGAADFLVKPIRKNELKNLWQHVWRRCHSSSGSGSESGTQSQNNKPAKTMCNEECENNSDSSDDLNDYGSNGPSNRDGSDNGSGTQSSWTKRASDFDSPRPKSSAYLLADGPDSTCAQVIQTKPESISNIWLHDTNTKECQEKDGKHDNFAMGKDLEIGVSSNPDVQHDYHSEKLSSHRKRKQKNSEVDSMPLENGKLEHISEKTCTKLINQTPELITRFASSVNPHAESKIVGTSNFSGISQLEDKSCCEYGELPSLELSLKRFRRERDGGNASNDDHNVLRHSDLSAFSKYNTGSSANQGPTENVGSCSPLDNSSAVIKTENTLNVPFHLSNTLLNQQSNGSSTNNDMASTAKNVTAKPEAFNDKSESTSAFKSFHSSAFHPVQSDRTSHPQQMIPVKVEDAGTVRGVRKQVQVRHHHHHHHYHHHVHIQQQNSPQEHDEIPQKNMEAVAPQCGSSNIFGGPTEGNAGNCSMNGSVSGSNHGSNGKNGSNTALNNELTNMETDNTTAGNNAAGGLSRRINGTAVDEDRIAHREAALSKFRQKRKERCFDKKVRYQSRKKLAEQRPRIKGQFVRQTMSESSAGRDCQSNDLTSEDNSSDSVR
ncbi:two-component response regulator-like PRR73 [Mercurialis annua]|uniref:two-component response regulator-like PRR73 n=1 Tax=Mercurialis annua TaxID=3986 RepID=UPI00215FE756|nr:two-component response regulator-like PRR73 [Mercurialis annua]XP_050231305.1 two-component response regulator-like PRR73 [Mercurialis annua]